MTARLAIQKFTGFNEDGHAAYAKSAEERALPLARDGDLALPLLIADAAEREAFGIHEIMLRLRTSLLARDAPRSYGAVEVTADVPAASILLDGGFVGRITEGTPVLLGNVLSGDRDLRVVDFSGREARRTVRVVEGRTIQASLAVLNLPTEAPADSLHPVGRNPQGYEEYWRWVDGTLVVRVPAGDFLMGSAEGHGEPNERPQHKVHVSEFLIDKTEVTWRQMRKFHEATGQPLPRAPISGTPDHYPASFVLWDEAAAYCRWVGGRLPTEAEWEKAARGTDGRDYPWGDRWDPARCNTISGGLHQVEDVGSYPGCLSPYGVLDLAGGMWEWCGDWYADDYYARSPAADPQGPETGTLRVKRGGAWMSQPNWVRATYRDRGAPWSRNADHGLRCVQEAPGK
jgi:formylglycine-generating enzyme required for sulfatase activity